MLTIKDVEKVASLARLKLTDKEKEMFLTQLDNILSYIEKLNEIKTDDVLEFKMEGFDNQNFMRPDEVKNYNFHEDLMKNAPSTDGKFLKVKKVIE